MSADALVGNSGEGLPCDKEIEIRVVAVSRVVAFHFVFLKRNLGIDEGRFIREERIAGGSTPVPGSFEQGVPPYLTKFFDFDPANAASMPAYWSLCDVALVHLKDEPLFETVIPSKFFEAMGMGRPVLLASPKGEASEILAESGAGLWVRPEQPKELMEAIQLLKSNRTLYQRVAASSIAAAPKYSRERQAGDMLAILGEAARASAKNEFALAPPDK